MSINIAVKNGQSGLILEFFEKINTGFDQSGKANRNSQKAISYTKCRSEILFSMWEPVKFPDISFWLANYTDINLI
jgi:hypothetical protein